MFEVSSKKRRAQLDIAEGCIVEGTVGGTRASALAALRTMLSWKVGRFAFVPGIRPLPAERTSIAAYLLEATRLKDESTRVELPLPPSQRRPEPRSATTALGGPSSILDDVAPPSSRVVSEERLRRHPPPCATEGLRPRRGNVRRAAVAQLNFELSWPYPAAPPTLPSLARRTAKPSSQRGVRVEESDPPTLPRAGSRPPPSRPSSPGRERQSTAEMGELSRGSVAPPETQPASHEGPPRATPNPPETGAGQASPP